MNIQIEVSFSILVESKSTVDPNHMVYDFNNPTEDEIIKFWEKETQKIMGIEYAHKRVEFHLVLRKYDKGNLLDVFDAQNEKKSSLSKTKGHFYTRMAKKSKKLKKEVYSIYYCKPLLFLIRKVYNTIIIIISIIYS